MKVLSWLTVAQDLIMTDTPSRHTRVTGFSLLALSSFYRPGPDFSTTQINTAQNTPDGTEAAACKRSKEGQAVQPGLWCQSARAPVPGVPAVSPFPSPSNSNNKSCSHRAMVRIKCDSAGEALNLPYHAEAAQRRRGCLHPLHLSIQAMLCWARGASLVAQMVKNPPAMQETQV